MTGITSLRMRAIGQQAKAMKVCECGTLSIVAKKNENFKIKEV